MERHALIDITRELFSCRVYPGDRAPRFESVCRMPQDDYNLSDISLCVHNGTHVDAPRHFLADGPTIDALALETFFGPCTVAQLCGEVTGADMARVLQTSAERLLLKGGLVLTNDATEAAARSHLRLLGIEGLTVGPEDAPGAAHRSLLSRGVAILENLDLSQAAPGGYLLSAFPLKLGGLEASPVRAVLVRL